MAIIECGPGCTTENKNSGRGCTDSQRSYEGAVLRTYEVNGYDDSDFIAVVWDADAGKLRSICYASTRGWTYHNGATVDATPDVIAAATPGMVEALTRYYADRALSTLREVDKGKRVRSLTTRGKNKDVTGDVRWIGENAYRYGAQRVGIKCPGEDKLRYLDADRVEVIDIPDLDLDGIRARAAREVLQGRWQV